MANALYDKAKEGFLNGSIDLLTDAIKVVLVDNGAYAVNIATHTFLSDIPTAARISTSPNMTSKTTTAGAFDAADVVFTAVSGVVSESLVIYQDTGTGTTSRLVCYIDNAAGLPVTPNGGNITVAWDNGANRIFKLNA